jgi:hypothetical protein
MPKYRIGKDPGLQPNSSMYWLSQFFASPKQKISLLWKLILRPDSCSKAQRIVLMLWACSRLWSIKRIVSSAYCSIDNANLAAGTHTGFNFARVVDLSGMMLEKKDSRGNQVSRCKLSCQKLVSYPTKLKSSSFQKKTQIILTHWHVLYEYDMNRTLT